MAVMESEVATWVEGAPSAAVVMSVVAAVILVAATRVPHRRVVFARAAAVLESRTVEQVARVVRRRSGVLPRADIRRGTRVVRQRIHPMRDGRRLAVRELVDCQWAGTPVSLNDISQKRRLLPVRM